MIDRAYGALVGGAIGDAMGMPASFLTRKEIRETYGFISDFLKPEAEKQVYHAQLDAGDITDDTMEGVILSKVLIENNGFSESAFNEEMKKWAIEQKMLESTVIGPSTRRFLEALIEGKDPKLTSGKGCTNGSAMRVAPVGIKYYDDFDACVKAAAESSLPSHGSKPAVAAACAVAAAVAAGVKGGYSASDVLNIAADAAEYGEKVGTDICAPSVSKRIRMIENIVDGCGDEKDISDVLDEIVGIFGASMFAYESVPVALAVFYAVKGNARDGILAAVNAGDDADTNGSICGAICGAYSGTKYLPDRWMDIVQKKSSTNFKKTAEELLKR
ncbi:MAG: ADP-ribosylglycohydrolase family protein [Clostridia bacterium]|jgi:ADP-ribosylglycohydrolase|nr:ADP-ribosylglycohydrolase family protein [Clostridia bacterium]